MTTNAAHTDDHGHQDGPPPLRRFYQLLLPERQDILTVLIFAVLTGILYLATPLAVDALVNNLAFGAAEGVYVQALLVLSFALFGFLCLMGLVRGAQYYVTEIIQRRIFVRLTADLAYRLPRVRMDALDQKLGPDLVNRFFDVVTVQKSSSMILLDSVNLAMGTFVSLLILGFYHPFLLLFDLLLIVYLVFVLLVVGRGAITTAVEESYAKHRVAAWLEQVALFPYLFKSEGAGSVSVDRANDLAEGYLEARIAHWRVLFRQIIGFLILQAVASAALLGLGGFLVLEGELTLGQLVAAELIVSAIVANLASLGKHAESFYDALAAVDKIGYVVDLPVEREDGEVPRGKLDPKGAQLEVRDLTFGYDRLGTVFQDVSFELQPGDRVALTGAAGSGTSTLLDVISGMREIQAGSIRVDGLDLRDWNLDRLRDDVTLVRGHDLVQGTIEENVLFGRSNFSRQDVREALRSVGILDQVLRMPQGIDTPLKMMGRRLSYSQRTRLVIARAILDKPRLLLLDQSLENLGPKVFKEITDFVFDERRPWTIVIVSADDQIMDMCHRRIDMSEFTLPQNGGGR